MGRGKNLLLISVLSSLLLLATSPSVFAYPLKIGDEITLHNGPGTTNGGEFIIKENGTVIHNTFCLERYETFSYGQELIIKGISDYATAGGGGAFIDSDGISKDYLSAETMYLYYHFFIGDLQYYDYNDAALREEDANELQRAIWMLEGEISVAGNYFIDLVELVKANPTSNWTAGIDSVKVLNLFKADGSNAQDQLTVVPEPGALLSLGLVLLGLGGITRRRFKK